MLVQDLNINVKPVRYLLLIFNPTCCFSLSYSRENSTSPRGIYAVGLAEVHADGLVYGHIMRRLEFTEFTEFTDASMPSQTILA